MLIVHTLGAIVCVRTEPGPELPSYRPLSERNDCPGWKMDAAGQRESRNVLSALNL